MSPAEVEQQPERIRRAALVVRDREHSFAEDVMINETGAVDHNLGIMAKVSSLTETLRLGGSCELVSQRWAQLTLSAVRVIVEVKWSPDEVLVGNSTCSVSSTSQHVCIHFVALLVYLSQWDVPLALVSWHQVGEITRELQRRLR